MRTPPFRFVIVLLALACASESYTQWEWAGGVPPFPPGIGYETVASAGKWIIAGANSEDGLPACSTDGGESWAARGGIGPVAFNPVLVTSPAETLALAVGYGYTVYRMRDTAEFWTRSDSGLSRSPILGLACLRPAGSPGVVIAASPTAGVFVSTDRGAHWSPSNNGLPTLRAMTVVAIGSAFLVGTADRGVFRSGNNGLTWSPSSAGLTDSNISALATLSGLVFVASGTNVFRSADDGKSWSLVPRSAPAPVQNLVLVPTPGRGIGVAFFVVTAIGDYRLAATDSDWVLVKGTPPTTFPADLPFTLTAADSMLYAVDPDQMTCSSDLGRSWFQVGRNIHAEIRTGHLSSKYPRPRLYSGPFVSTNFGSKWISMHQSYSDGSHVAMLSLSPDTSELGFDRLTIGTDSGAVEFSYDGGRTWKVIHQRQLSARGHGCFGVTELEGVIFASLQLEADQFFRHKGDTVSGIFRTTTDGASWEKISTPGLSDSLVLSLDLLRAPDGGRVLFAGTWFNLFRSTDDGATWSAAIGPVRTGRKRFRQANGSLFLSTEGTVQATYLDDGLPVSSYDSAGVYWSGDMGLTWTEISGDLHAAFVRGFAAVPSPNDPAKVFLAASRDAYGSPPEYQETILTSTEGGMRWRPFLDAPVSYNYLSSPVGADEHFVYWFSRRRPWSQAELTSDGMVSVSDPTGFLLSQNFPNPFNPSTTISYSVPHRLHVSLAVFDILGQKVADLINDEIEAGPHHVQFNAGNLASGVYFYRLKAGSFEDVKKLLLIR